MKYFVRQGSGEGRRRSGTVKSIKLITIRLLTFEIRRGGWGSWNKGRRECHQTIWGGVDWIDELQSKVSLFPSIEAFKLDWKVQLVHSIIYIMSGLFFDWEEERAHHWRRIVLKTLFETIDRLLMCSFEIVLKIIENFKKKTRQ